MNFHCNIARQVNISLKGTTSNDLTLNPNVYNNIFILFELEFELNSELN